jgi:hypothetical protein
MVPAKKDMLDSDSKGPRPLREIEEEVLEEGREWMRQRLQKRLQEEATRHGEVFPPGPEKGAAPAAKKDAVAHRRRRR